MSEFQSWAFMFLNIVLYATAIGSFAMFLLFVYKNLAPKLLSGNLSFKYIVSMAVGVMMLMLIVMFLPYQLAKAVQYGFLRYMPVMMETAQVVVDGTNDIFNGNMPVYVEPSGNTTVLNYSAPTVIQAPTVPSSASSLHNSGGLGNEAILQDDFQRPGLNGEPMYDQSGAGGGSPNQPTDEWVVGMPPPTPSVFSQPTPGVQR